MLSRCSNLGIARAAPPCTVARPMVGGVRKSALCFAKASIHREKIQCRHLNFLPMFRRQEPSAIYRRTVGEHSARYTKVQNAPDTSAMFSTCSCKHRCIFDVMISAMVGWSIADPSPMLADVPELLRCYGDAPLSVRNLISDWSPMITWALL